MTAIDDLLANNAAYAESFGKGDLPGPPSRHVAVLTCMDARLDVYAALGLGLGEAHVLRVPGGVVTDHELQMLAISQRKLGTNEVMVVHHTRCGVQGLDDDAFAAEIEADTGIRPDFTPIGFADLDDDVRSGVTRVRECVLLPHRDQVRGFVYDVDTGSLREVT